MGFKRFVAANTKDAMTQVRRDLGDDAVILSNKRLASGQIEILAAASEAVEQIVEDARKPATARNAAQVASVQIAPGVRRVGAPVESFHEYLQRQGSTAAASNASPVRSRGPATVGGASMYSAVAAAPAHDEATDDFADSVWADASPTRGAAAAESRFAPSRLAATRGPASVPATTARAHTAGGARSAIAAQTPQFDTWLPNDARHAPIDPRTAPEPAVFRRRPSRELPPAMTAQPPVAAVEPVRATAAATGLPLGAAPVTAAAVMTQPMTQARVQPAPQTLMQSMPQPMPQTMQQTAAPTPAPVAAELPRTEIRLPAPAPESANAQLMAELASLRASLQQQLNSLSSTVAATDSMRRNPLQTRVMTRLLTSGFSVDVARKIALNAPELADADAADAWMQDVVAHNLRCARDGEGIVERAGQGGHHVYALVGPTGVGKTTTAAKLAARFAVKYGTQGLGLVTLDAYRVAAHEQLRTYGRILGTPVHMAQDAATLRELLASMRSKRLVLIDTCGVGPRDERLAEMLAVLAQAGQGGQPVQPVLLLNAASHAETLDETARAWRATEAAGTILTKLDEAARIGGALDCALRYKLKLLALTNGQRVPEDIHQPNARLLAHLALKPSSQTFALADDEGAALAHLSATAGAVHA